MIQIIELVNWVGFGRVIIMIMDNEWVMIVRIVI